MKKNPRLSSDLYFISLYFVAVSVLYLWGYWSTFNINILEYISLSDIVKISAYPIVSSFIFFAIGAVIGEFIPGRRLVISDQSDTKFGRWLNRYIPYIAPIYFISVVIYYNIGDIEKWYILPLLIGYPFGFIVSRTKILGNLIKNENIRQTTVILLTILPLYAFGWGQIKSNSILNGKEYQYLASSTIEGLNIGDFNDKKNHIKFLGHANQNLFFLLSDNKSIFITKLDKTKGYILKYYRADTLKNTPKVQNSQKKINENVNK